MVIKDFLNEKDCPAENITGDDPLTAAIELMAARNVKALIVSDNTHPVGIISASDILRAYAASGGRDIGAVPVADVMTPELITAEAGETVVAAITRMREAGIRHLPIQESGRLVAVVTLENLICHQLENLGGEIDHLNDYIIHLHDAMLD